MFLKWYTFFSSINFNSMINLYKMIYAHRGRQPIEVRNVQSIERWCFTDGSWKNKDFYSGESWYSTLEGFDGLMGTRNVRASLLPLHAEMEALIWTMNCMRNLHQFQVTFATDCSQLVNMVSEPEE